MKFRVDPQVPAPAGKPGSTGDSPAGEMLRLDQKSAEYGPTPGSE